MQPLFCKKIKGVKYEGFGSNYQTYMGNLTENGIYFIEVICKSYTCELGGSFNSFIIGDIMDTIDLSKNVYFKDREIDFDDYGNDHHYGTIDYKVSNLNENKYVYFVMERYLSNEYIYRILSFCSKILLPKIFFFPNIR